MAIDLDSAQLVPPRMVPLTEYRPAATEEIPIKIQSATAVEPIYPSGAELPPLPAAGVNLTKRVLWILSGVLILLISALIYQEYQFAEVAADGVRSTIGTAAMQVLMTESVEHMKARQELVREYGQMVTAARDFAAKMAQMILLNLLLPVLTALLGYVFASKSAEK